MALFIFIINNSSIHIYPRPKKHLRQLSNAVTEC